LKWQPVTNPASHSITALKKSGQNGVPEAVSKMGYKPDFMFSTEDY
jgi:hypothetical protein